jgi:predicted ribosome quality control (RQC) complex YloA/Tae2 family protein
VGRGAASNDALTFRWASPNDVWLHARGAAGAHVVLRWQRDEPPPARDLEEAALLAAWHSKARGATVVPVDWTRRKHVRKPRGGSPGLVVVQHARTIMARPDAATERRLRATTHPADS